METKEIESIKSEDSQTVYTKKVVLRIPKKKRRNLKTLSLSLVLQQEKLCQIRLNLRKKKN